MNTFFITIPRLAFALSGHSVLCKLYTMLLLQFFVVSRSTFLKGKELRVSFIRKGVLFSLVLLTKFDIAALKEVFLNEEYRLLPSVQPKTILDLGANFGDTPLYFHTEYPDAIIYAVEPDPQSYSRLLQSTAHITKIVPVNVAIGPKDGEMDLHSSSKSSLRNSLVERENCDTVTSVRTVTMRTLYTELGIARTDICKFDVEGSEAYLFLDTVPEALADVFLGEIHEDLMENINVSHFKRLFSSYDTSVIATGRKGRHFLTAYAGAYKEVLGGKDT